MLVFKGYNMFFYTSGDDAPGITDAYWLRFRSTNLGTAGCGLRATLLSALWPLGAFFQGGKDGKKICEGSGKRSRHQIFSSNFVWNLGWNDDFIKMEICFWLMNWEMICVARWSLNSLRGHCIRTLPRSWSPSPTKTRIFGKTPASKRAITGRGLGLRWVNLFIQVVPNSGPLQIQRSILSTR